MNKRDDRQDRPRDRDSHRRAQLDIANNVKAKSKLTVSGEEVGRGGRARRVGIRHPRAQWNRADQGRGARRHVPRRRPDLHRDAGRRQQLVEATGAASDQSRRHGAMNRDGLKTVPYRRIQTHHSGVAFTRTISLHQAHQHEWPAIRRRAPLLLADKKGRRHAAAFLCSDRTAD